MYTERVLLSYIIGGYFLSPIIMNWAKDLGSNQWFFPYLIWAFLILASIWATRSKNIDGI